VSLAGFAHFLETLLGAPFPPPPARSVCGALWDRARRFFRDPLGTDIVSQVLELQAEDLSRGDAYRLHRARERLCGVTTEKLKTDHVLPYTAASRVSLASQLRASGSAHVAPANVFISHAYQYNFLDVFDAMLSWEAAQRAVGDTAPGPFFYYFDLFCVNQHSQNQNAVVPEIKKKRAFGTYASSATGAASGARAALRSRSFSSLFRCGVGGLGGVFFRERRHLARAPTPMHARTSAPSPRFLPGARRSD